MADRCGQLSCLETAEVDSYPAPRRTDGNQRAQSAQGHDQERHPRGGHGEVVVDIGGQEVVSLISKASVERLGLKPGDFVVAIIKATEVMIGK